MLPKRSCDDIIVSVYLIYKKVMAESKRKSVENSEVDTVLCGSLAQ